MFDRELQVLCEEDSGARVSELGSDWIAGRQEWV